MPPAKRRKDKGVPRGPMGKRPKKWSVDDAPVVEVSKPRHNRIQRPITELRRRVFLEVLAETGSQYAAAEAATPWVTSHGGGLQGFRRLAELDPEFREQWRQAEQAALARVESEITRRALNPLRKPIIAEGVMLHYPDDHPARQCDCGHERRAHGPRCVTVGCNCRAFAPAVSPTYAEEHRYDNQLLLKLAKKLDPGAWSDAQELRHSGKVDSDVRTRPDLRDLSDDELDMVAKLAQAQLVRQGVNVNLNVSVSGEGVDPDDGDEDEETGPD